MSKTLPRFGLKLPTLAEINNDHSAARATLLLFRVLCSSDLTFYYSLLKKGTLLDLLEVGRDLTYIDEQSLTDDEKIELSKMYHQIEVDLHLQKDERVCPRCKIVIDPNGTHMCGDCGQKV